MKNSIRIVGTLVLAAAFVAPTSIMAAAAPPQVGVQVRVYDRHHKDYHNWDDRENHAWGVYLTNNHRRHYEYTRANRREQDRYWAWRHSHPDRD
jgi:hypothetical protein